MSTRRLLGLPKAGQDGWMGKTMKNENEWKMHPRQSGRLWLLILV